MATRRRRKAGGRRRVYARRAAPNPRRRRANPVHRRRRHAVFARRRRHTNPVHHRRRHRRRNPHTGVSGGEVINFAISGMALAIAQPIVGNIVGGFAGNLLGQFTSPAITALTGWGLGQLASMTHTTSRFARPLVVLGLSTAVIQIVQPYISGLLGGSKAAAPTMHGWPQGYSGWHPQRIGAVRRRGFPMRGIGVVTGIPPTITAPPMPPAATAPAATGMQGIGVRPGVWAH